MLEARSVALVGATPRNGSIGRQMLLQLVEGGFDGGIYPVNPRYSTLEGFACYPVIGDVPHQVDLAIFAVTPSRLETLLVKAAEAGVRSAVIFGGTADPEGRQMMERWGQIAQESGMALCGPNGMGFINFEQRLRATGYSQPLDLEPGNVTFITHSGSAFSAWLHNRRDMRFNLVVSTGNELVCSMDKYLGYAARLPSTRAAALLVETVRHPAGLAAALEQCHRSGIPVAVLKVGRTERGAASVATHSGAIAGDDAAFDAFLEAHGAVQAETLDELADTVELLAAGREAAHGGLSTVHDSGGERALVIDLAEHLGIPLATVSPVTRQVLTEVLEPGLEPENPVDAWGSGIDSDDQYSKVAAALLKDHATAALGFGIDLIEVGDEYGYVEVVKESFLSTEKPVAVLSNFGAAIDQYSARHLRGLGIPVLEGTRSGLLAFSNLFAIRDHLPRPVPPEHHPHREAWRRRLQTPNAWSETEALTLLADYGISVVAHRPADDLQGALAAAKKIGYPVALKTAAPGVLHKTDSGGVFLDLADATQLEAAYRAVSAVLGPAVLVAAMASPGLELALGAVNDPQFGTVILAAAGGTLIELISDRSVALPPIGEAAATRMIDRLKVRKLLDGARGRQPVAVALVTHCLLALSWLCCDLGDLIESLDVNPLIAGPDSSVAVDALLVPLTG